MWSTGLSGLGGQLPGGPIEMSEFCRQQRPVVSVRDVIDAPEFCRLCRVQWWSLRLRTARAERGGDQVVVERFGVLSGEKRRSRRLLLTTNTELNAMAAPAMSGLRRPSAARGMAATL
jgi:hypothetical protein